VGRGSGEHICCCPNVLNGCGHGVMMASGWVEHRGPSCVVLLLLVSCHGHAGVGVRECHASPYHGHLLLR